MTHLMQHLGTEDQKCRHVSFAVNFLDSYPDPRRLKWIVTTDESYFHVYDPESKIKNMQWKEKTEVKLPEDPSQLPRS